MHAPELKQVLNHILTEAPLCGVWVIPGQIVNQLIDSWSVNHHHLDILYDCTMVQSISFHIEDLEDHSSLLVDV